MAKRPLPLLLLCVLTGACGESSASDSMVWVPSITSPDASASGDAESDEAGAPAQLDASTSVPDDASQDDGAIPKDAGTPDDAEAPTGVRLNHLQFAGTHNSYHQQPSPVFHPSHAYTHAPLDAQLAAGVRALELDLHRELDGEIHVYHIAVIDPRTSCDTFADCLDVIGRWSDENPGHTPVVVWLELKNETGGTGITDAVEVEPTIRGVLGEERLITPDLIQGDHASPRARIAAEGWPRIAEVAGKFMFVLLTRGDPGRLYTRDYTSLAGRLMFANTEDRFDDPWAVVSKLDVDEVDKIERAHAAQMLIATNVCAADKSDAQCEQIAKTATDLGIHMLKDDFPLPVSSRTYSLVLPAGSPGCNPVTADAACVSGLLEPVARR